MSGITFDWNPRKAATNLQKHGVSFDEAKTVFFDENARVISDPDHSVDEERFVIIGISASTRLLVVYHCYKDDDNTIRLISARKATRTETKQYRGFLS